jgi:hypothetical protein
MKHWLARLSFSFLILAGVCAWEAYQTNIGRRPGAPEWRAALLYAIAAVLFVMFLLGVRERHRPPGEP